ncbi:lactate utilization protein [Candidatus Parcubacteria bacterium]|nr:lactate utilization protein [Candidatus Parcubacteria bacterium]
MDYRTIPASEIVTKTIEALKANGINAQAVKNGEEAKQKVLEMIPEGSQVMTMTSVTLDTLGISQVLNESGKYESVKKILGTLDSKTQAREKRALGAVPDYAVGSVHGVTEDGHLIIASNTGSQLPAYAYGAGKVIWVVGTHKIVKDFDTAMNRLYTHTLPLESERAKKAYGMPGSNVSKMLVINKEVAPDRLHLIFVPEALGF